MRDTLLTTARSGNLPLLHERLQRATNHEHELSRGLLSVEAKLLDEALTYAKAGDLEEATHRLRLRAEPKWASLQDCRRAYSEAMKTKRARS